MLFLFPRGLVVERLMGRLPRLTFPNSSDARLTPSGEAIIIQETVWLLSEVAPLLGGALVNGHLGNLIGLCPG